MSESRREPGSTSAGVDLGGTGDPGGRATRSSTCSPTRRVTASSPDRARYGDPQARRAEPRPRSSLRDGDEDRHPVHHGQRGDRVRPDRRIAWQTYSTIGWLARFGGGRIWRYELEPVDGGTLVRETWDISQEARVSKRNAMKEQTRTYMIRNGTVAPADRGDRLFVTSATPTWHGHIEGGSWGSSGCGG